MWLVGPYSKYGNLGVGDPVYKQTESSKAISSVTNFRRHLGALSSPDNETRAGQINRCAKDSPNKGSFNREGGRAIETQDVLGI